MGRLTTAKASPRRQLVRADTLCSTETFEKQRGTCSAVQVFVIVVACAGIYVAGLRRPFMRSAYPQHPPSAACYITTEELYVPHHTNATRVTTHITGGYKHLHKAKILSQCHKNHTNFRVVRKREAWHKHGAVIQQRLPPSRLHKSSTPWLLAMVVCGV